MILVNQECRRNFALPPVDVAPLAVHRRLPGYAPTPLVPLPGLAQALGVREVHAKVEGGRLGLPAYKVLGGSWAAYRTLGALLGRSPEPWDDIASLRAAIATLRARTLVTASDGNHGRGVARVARWLGWPAEIFLPLGTVDARIQAIRDEGATVVEVAGTYDETVERAAARAGGGAIVGSGPGSDALLIQDHGWPGYEQIPAWVAEGYATIFQEVDQQLASVGAPPPGLVAVQIGVGTLATAVVRHFKAEGRARRPWIVGVEPVAAACAYRSVEAGKPVMLEARAGDSIMAGLVCGTPSLSAWPALLHGIETYVAVDDDRARDAMRRYASEGVIAGESGAAGLAGLLELFERPVPGLPAGSTTSVLLIVTEGATDPTSWETITGRTLT